MEQLKKALVGGLLSLLMISLVVLPVLGSSISEIEGKKVDKNIDTINQPSPYINFFCNIEIEGEGIMTPSESGPITLITLSWKTIPGIPQPTIKIRGFLFWNNLNNDNARSLGYCLNFRGDIWQDPSSDHFRISGKALFAVYTADELD